MTVIPNWTTFRETFSEAVTESVTAAFVAGAPATITRGAGDFTTNFDVGMSIDISGSATNDFRFTIAAVVAGTITLATGDVLVTEGAIAVVIDGALRDPDAIETWPINLVRFAGSSFGDNGTTITGILTPYLGSSFTVTCNAGAVDAVQGTDEYDWYLSQRTDDAALQYLSIVQKADAGGNSYSGSVDIVHTSTAVSVLGIAANPSPQRNLWLFKHVDLYVQRRSDKAIQWISLLRAMVANTAS